MTSLYDHKGHKQACTVIEAGPCVVTQLKTVRVDGYQAVQLAYGDKKEKNTTKPLLGHFSKASALPKREVVEFKCLDDVVFGKIELGQTVLLDQVFSEGDFLDVIGTSKGRGFQGVVKRHGFSGVGGRSHGQHNRERAPGSIGACSFPGRVFKGMRMAGRMGGARVKVSNLKVVKILPEKDVIVVSGAVPGAINGCVILEK